MLESNEDTKLMTKYKINKNLDKMAAKMAVYYKIIRKIYLKPVNSRDSHAKC